MTWPQLLNPWTALIAGAIAIPLLVLLYFLKLRRQERVISSTFLWKKAIQDLQVNAPFQKLRRNLLLLLQLLALILLAFAVARPVVSHTPSAGTVSVILLDRSASMSARDVGGHTRLEEAKKQATDLIDSMKRGSRAMVIAFDDTAQTIQPFTTDTAALRRAVESVQPTDRYSRLKLAFQLADAQLAFIPEQNRSVATPPDVWLYSDGRVQDSSEDLTLRGNLKYVKLGSEDSTNIAIVALSAKRNFEKPTEVQVFARLANYGPQIVNTDVQLSVDGKLAKVASVSLPPQRWTNPEWKRTHAAEIPKDFSARDSVEFTIDLPEAAVLKLQHNFKDDIFPADDVAQIVVPPARSLKLMLVTEGNHFLRKLLGAMALKDARVITPAEYDANVPADQDLIIFDRYLPKSLPAAGTFIYFSSLPPNSKLKPVMEEDRIVTLGEPRVQDWRREHPILRYLSLNKLWVSEMMQLQLPLEAQVLVDSNRGPLMVLYREPSRLHLVVTFDLMQSNWPVVDSSFPVFFHNAVQFMALSSQVNVRESLPPGSSPTLERALLNRVSPNLASLDLVGPSGTTKLSIAPTADCVLPPMDKTGLYETKPAVPGAEKLAVNLLSEAESNTTPVSTPPGRSGQVIATAVGGSRLELWWWIIAAGVIPLTLVEWWVYTRRVHL